MEQDNCTHDCASCGSDCGDKIEEIDVDALHALSSIRKTYIIASAKGGVGKSAVTALLATELAKTGLNIGILDGSMSSSVISLMFGTEQNPEIIKGGIYPVKTKNGISIISFPLLSGNPSAPMFWDGAKSAIFAKQFWTDVIWDNIDILLIDTSSDTADVTQMFFALKSIDGVIVVTDPGDISGVVAARTINYAKMRKLSVIGLIEDFSDRKTEKDTTAALRDGFGISLLDRIPFDQDLFDLANRGKIEEYRKSVLTNTVKVLTDLSD